MILIWEKRHRRERESERGRQINKAGSLTTENRHTHTQKKIDRE